MPLHWASLHGHEEIVKLLINRGASVDSKNKYGKTPLYLASARGHKKIVAFLIKHGAYVDSQDQEGYTSLHGASSWGHTEIVEFLLKKNASVHCQNKSGETPLYHALLQGRQEIVDLLSQGLEPFRAELAHDPHALHKACNKVILQKLLHYSLLARVLIFKTVMAELLFIMLRSLDLKRLLNFSSNVALMLMVKTNKVIHRCTGLAYVDVKRLLNFLSTMTLA